MSSTPTLRTGRTTTFLLSLLAVLMMAVLGVGQFAGLTAGTTFTLLEGLALTLGAAALLAEIFFEGQRKGLSDRQYTSLDLFGAVAGTGLLVTGVSALASAATGSTLVALPEEVKGFVFLFNTVLLARELFTE